MSLHRDAALIAIGHLYGGREGLEGNVLSILLNSSQRGQRCCLHVCVSVVSPGELLRKKRRENGGHKDPLLQEISHLQEEVMTQISNLRKEHEAAEKKRSEIEKVALILGLSLSDRPRRSSKLVKEQEDGAPPPVKEKREADLSPEGQQAASSSLRKVGLPAQKVRQDIQSVAGGGAESRRVSSSWRVGVAASC